MGGKFWNMLPAAQRRFNALHEDDRATMRMLINTLLWTSVGVIVVLAVVTWAG